MEQKQTKTTSNLRPLWLTAAFCFTSIAAALDIAYGTYLFGHLLLMVMLGIYTVILMTCERYIVFLNAAASLVLMFITSGGDLSLVCFGAVLILTGKILSVLILKRCTKTTAVLTAALCVSIGYLLVAAIFYAAAGNSLAPSDMLDDINAFFDSLKVPLADATRTLYAELSAEMIEYYESYGYTIDYFVKGVEEYVDYIQMLMPGLMIFAVEVFAYVAVSIFAKTASTARYDAILPEAQWVLYPTQASCILYMVVTCVYVVSMFFSPYSTFSILVVNFWLVMIPVMLACGFRSLRARLHHPRMRRQTIIILILFGIGIFFLPDAALELGALMLTFIGAQDVSAARAVESSISRRDKE